MYTKALKKAQRESVETTIRRRRLLFAGAVQRAHNERLTRRVMLGRWLVGGARDQADQKRTGPNV